MKPTKKSMIDVYVIPLQGWHLEFHDVVNVVEDSVGMLLHVHEGPLEGEVTRRRVFPYSTLSSWQIVKKEVEA